MAASAYQTTTGAPHGRVLSPVLVGRDGELAVVRAALARAATEGRGAAIVLRGEAGVGKTRLARAALDVAHEQGSASAVGRGVQQGSSAYRPLAEALFQVARRHPVLADPELVPVRAALGRIVPDWRGDGAAVDEPAVVVAEAVLRLLRRLGGQSGALLVLEDIHWADPESLAVFEYLADNVNAEPVVVLATVRPDVSAEVDAVIDALHVRGAAAIVDLRRLTDDEVEVMVRACIGEAASEAVVRTVTARSDGLPLLVEELLSVGERGSSDALPRSFAESVNRRVGALPAETVLVLQCAAVLGRRFEWALLPELADLTREAVVAALERGVAAQLVDVEPGGSFRFHHALTRDVVFESVLPPTRAALAARAARSVEASGDGDDLLVLAADLWELAGNRARAAGILVAAGRRAVDVGALATAEVLLRRARALTVDPALAVAIGEVLVEALALAAKVDEAVELGERTLAELAATGDERRRAALHLVLARAAVAATRWPAAREHLERAAELGRRAGDEQLLARVESLGAHVAMGELRLEDAVQLADRARIAAERHDLPDLRCEALEIIGRRERLLDLAAAEAAFSAALETARRNGLRLAAIRALHELGTIDMFRSSSPGRLIEARDLAAESGALSLAATVELQLLGLLAFRFELDAAMDLGRSLVGTAARLGAPDLHAAALLQLGFAYALAGRRDEMERVVEAGLAVAGDHPEAHALAWGHARATASLIGEERERARRELGRSMDYARKVPGVPGAFAPLWALLEVLHGAGRDPIDTVRRLEAQAIPMNDALLGYAEAVVLWREGDDARARERFERDDAVLLAQQVAGVRHLARRLVAEFALAEQWGDGARWLREALDHFQRTGHERVAAACAALLRGAGERVPRRRTDIVPGPLRPLGVTAREAEVLELLEARLTNKEIAGRLFLSPRTVEKHVERLLQKLGVKTRAELAARRWTAEAAEHT